MSNVFINQSKIEQTFLAFLQANSISEKTQGNYVSDVRHFIEWLVSFFHLTGMINDITATLNNVTGQTIESYKTSQVTVGTPVSTVNRRLSSIRMFFKWANESGFTKTNPTVTIKNIIGPSNEPDVTVEAIIGKFADSLKNEGAADVTIKNYINDISEFLTWVIPRQSG
jgi:site-specific recombinase XerD